LLGWKPEISIEKGLETTIEWMKKNDIKFSAPFEGWPRSYRNNEKN
jgi:dTDP-D-glucose 4,6-dehydratase